jgi:hypothetical protein
MRKLAMAARWVDRSAFGKESDFAQTHQALLVALEKPGTRPFSTPGQKRQESCPIKAGRGLTQIDDHKDNRECTRINAN